MSLADTGLQMHHARFQALPGCYGKHSLGRVRHQAASDGKHIRKPAVEPSNLGGEAVLDGSIGVVIAPAATPTRPVASSLRHQPAAAHSTRQAAASCRPKCRSAGGSDTAPRARMRRMRSRLYGRLRGVGFSPFSSRRPFTTHLHAIEGEGGKAGGGRREASRLSRRARREEGAGRAVPAAAVFVVVIIILLVVGDDHLLALELLLTLQESTGGASSASAAHPASQHAPRLPCLHASMHPCPCPRCLAAPQHLPASIPGSGTTARDF
jgi:hypothetical protein